MDPVIEAPGPETEVIAPETPEAVAPDNKGPETQPQPEVENTQPDEVAVYQDVVAKYNEDPNYDMTENEVDAFLAVQDKINNGHMEEPPLKSKEDKPEEKEDPVTEEPEPEPEPTDEKDDKPITDSVSDSMMKSMEKVGAKDVTELPGKIDSLLKKMSESGGRLGSENVALKETVQTLQQKAANHTAWLEDLKAGKPEAVEYLQTNFNIDPGKMSDTVKAASTETDEGLLAEIDPDDFVDDKLARLVQGLQSVVKQQNNTIKSYAEKTKEVEQQSLTREAVTAWTDDIVRLVTDDTNVKHYGLSAPEARGLSEQYFDKTNSDKPIHPKFQKIHELILYAHKHNMPNLDTAHVMLQHESGQYANRVVEAIKQGQQSVNHAPSVNTSMSEKQSRGGSIPEPAVTDEVVERIERGDFDSIPDHWMDKQGNLIPSKVPQRFHEKAFGRAGKPK